MMRVYKFISLIFKSVLKAIYEYKRYSRFVGKYKQPTKKEYYIAYHNLKNAKNGKELLCDEDLEDIQSSLYILGKSNKRYSQQEVETKLGLAN